MYQKLTVAHRKRFAELGKRRQQQLREMGKEVLADLVAEEDVDEFVRFLGPHEDAESPSTVQLKENISKIHITVVCAEFKMC